MLLWDIKASVMTKTESPWLLSLETRAATEVPEGTGKLPNIQEDVSVEGIRCPDISRWRWWGGVVRAVGGMQRAQLKAETQV